MKFIKRFYWLILSLAFVVLDQFSKWVVVKTIPINDSIIVVPDFFSLTHVRNTGAAFGILSNQRWIFMVFTSIVIIVSVALLISKKVVNPWGILAFSLIIGGGIGNMIDRIFLGEVIDFFAFNFWGYQFAVFNVADIFVCCGTFLLAFYIFFSKDFDSKKKTGEMKNGEN